MQFLFSKIKEQENKIKKIIPKEINKSYFIILLLGGAPYDNNNNYFILYNISKSFDVFHVCCFSYAVKDRLNGSLETTLPVKKIVGRN